MNEILLFLNQPAILWSLFIAAVGLVLIDYLFPVDWPAYVGYIFFAIFIGATAPLSPVYSLLAMIAVVVLMLILHKTLFSRFLTNLPRHEKRREGLIAQRQNIAGVAQSEAGDNVEPD